MSTIKITPEQTANLLCKGIEVMLADKIREQVKVFRDQLVKEIDEIFEAACVSAAEQAVVRMVEYNAPWEDKPQLHFHFDKKK